MASRKAGQSVYWFQRLAPSFSGAAMSGIRVSLARVAQPSLRAWSLGRTSVARRGVVSIAREDVGQDGPGRCRGIADDRRAHACRPLDALLVAPDGPAVGHQGGILL